MVEAAPGSTQAAAAALASLARELPDGRVSARVRRAHVRAASARRERRDRASSTPLRVNMTPMIDVVFQLLVFFIATTRFATGENVLQMDLARRAVAAAPVVGSATAAVPDPFDYKEDALTLEVQPDGRIRAGAPLGRIMTPEELRLALTVECRGPEHPKGMFEPAFPIVIAPSTGTSWQDAVEALNAAVAAGFRNVGFEQRTGAASGALR